MNNIKTVSNRWFYLPIIILGIYLIIRIIDQSKLLYLFPLDFTNDISAYMAELFFLARCGFHNFCPYWYNGFISFESPSLGWSLFSLPIYWLTNNVQIATFISIVLMFILGFILIYLIGKNQEFSKAKIIAFFLFFFANAIAIGNFLRLGRVVSMFAFILFIALFTIILYYKEKKLDKKFFLLFIPLYSIILFSHQQEMILSHFLILSLFLIKKIREKIYILISSILGILISSFWLIPFLLNSIKNNVFNTTESIWLLSFSGPLLLTNIAGIIIPIALLITFYLYWINNKSKKEFLFFSPILILCILFLFRIVVFIPILKNISPDPYLMMFVFFIIFYFLNIKFKRKKIEYLFIIFMISSSLLSVYVSITHTPNFSEYTQLEKEVVSLFPYIEGRYIMVHNDNVSSYDRAYYSYGAIYYNLSSAGGWYKILTNQDYLLKYSKTISSYRENNCKEFIKNLDNLNVNEVLFYGYECNKLNKCELIEKKSLERACLYKRV